MKDFRIAAVQCRPPVGCRPEENLALVEGRLCEAKGMGADLITFPEATLSGYVLDPDEVRDRALQLDGPVVREAVALSGRLRTFLCFGFYEKRGSEIFNSYAVAGEGRLLGVARKVHIPARERGLFTGGREFKVFDLPFVKLGPCICYDNEFPESHVCLAVQGAELIVMPAAWAEHWEKEDYIDPCSTDEEVVRERQRWAYMMFGARARDTGTFSVHVNHSGMEAHGPWRFVGKSMIFAPTGRVLAEAKAWDDDIICADLKAQLLDDYLGMPSVAARSRNPKAYGPVVDDSPPRPLPGNGCSEEGKA